MLQIIAERIFGSALNQWIVGTYWLWPLLEIIHFIGLSLLIGGLVVVDLSLVGVLRGVSWAESHRLLPLVVAGFFLNLATGVLFFVGDPMRYSVNIAFQVKMVLIFLAGLNAAYYHQRLMPMLGFNEIGPIPINVRVIGVISLSIWFTVLALGRLIPYLGTG
jgi:hypothetical protein